MQALWRGNGANVFRLIPEVGLRFVLNDQLEILFSPTDGRPPTTGTHVAAGTSFPSNTTGMPMCKFGHQ